MVFTKKTAPNLLSYILTAALIAVPAARLYAQQKRSSILEIRVVVLKQLAVAEEIVNH